MPAGGLDQDIAEVAGRGDFSGQIVLRSAAETAYSGCFGLAERAHGAPVTERTRFGVASFTKMFTACAIAGLADEGALSFGDPIRDLIPPHQRPAWLPGDVTVHQALSHTSGLGDYLEEDELADGDPEPLARVLGDRSTGTLRETADYLALMDRVGVRPAPAPLAYSSTGSVLLGLVVEALTGGPYRAVVTERVLAPLGVGEAFPATDEVCPDAAVGYLPALRPGGPARTNVFSIPAVGGPDGGAYLTAAEMADFLQAYAADRVVPGLRDILLTAVEHDSDGDGYGYGVWLQGEGRTRRFGHSGFDPGFECHGWHWPEIDATLAITSNTNFAIGPVQRQLVELVTTRLG